MERVVKGLMGYGSEKEGKPATHIILTVEEYDNMIKEIENAKYKAEKIKVMAKEQVESYKKQADNMVSKEKENAQNEVYSIQLDLNSARKEIDRLNSLNSNLLRISRERANSKRGLKPKKAHHGYVVLDSQQNNYIHRWYNSKRIATVSTFSCWKVRIQSPYDCSIPFNVITKNIQEDLSNILGVSLGIDLIINKINEKSIKDIETLWNDENNFIFKTVYKSNYKSGLWEVEYLVKDSISFPKDMRVI